MLTQYANWEAATARKLEDTQRGFVQHRVKSWPQFFQPILDGVKTHDLRRKDDRDFRVGDTLLLQEFDPRAEKYTGREVEVCITYITSADYPCAYSIDGGLHPSLCILSIKRV